MNPNSLYFEDYKVYKTKKTSYINLACSFDIEVSSFEVSGEKYANMYLFGLGVEGRCILGRTYEDLKNYIDALSSLYQLSLDKRLVIYVHNLAYEFQFIRKHFKVHQVFSIDERKPIYVVLDNGIEFRCSYLLSGYKLEKVGEHLLKYKVNKLSGEIFDYEKLRTSKTPLNEYELEYILHDNYVVMAYIKELIERLGKITNIPLTKTAFVRKLLKNNCLYDGDTSHRLRSYKFIEYRNIMNDLVIKSVPEYKQLKRAFQGGFTHASATKVGKILNDVASNDFTSSYPYVLCSEEFPMSEGSIVHPKNKNELNKYLSCYSCIFDITFYDLEDIFHYEHYLSSSKCYIEGDSYCDNGRVVYASKLSTTITNVDYEIIKRCYKWSRIDISSFRIYEKGYLPKPIIESILDLYEKKTKLKGVEGSEIEYMSSKENINSVYGCMVTDIARVDIKYNNDEWKPLSELTDRELKDKLEEYNKAKNRVLFYPWGVFCTAYARFNLWMGIFEYKSDYAYSDTDSIKGLNYNKHKEFHIRYNKMCIEKLERMCKYHKIDFNKCIPKTIKGIEKPLGVWDYEGMYKRFKTLGAKRYMVESDEGISFTISGLNKNYGVPYLCDNWMCNKFTHKENFNPFDSFTNGMYIPPDRTGKLTHTYIDTPFKIKIKDYLGIDAEVSELSYIHLSKTDFTLSMTREFLDYIQSFAIDMYY